MKKISLALIAAGWLTAGLAQDNKPADAAAKPSPFKDERDKVSYSLGLNLGNFVKRQEFDPNTDQIVKAIRDVLDGKTPLIDEAEMRSTMMAWQKSQKEKGDSKRKEEGAKYLADNKAKEGQMNMTKTNTAVATASRAFAPGFTGKDMGRNGAEWRQDFLTKFFVEQTAIDPKKLTGTVKVGKTSKPAYEIAEREIAPRTFSARLMARKANGQLTEVAGPVKVGLFGKLLEKPATDAAAA